MGDACSSGEDRTRASPLPAPSRPQPSDAKSLTFGLDHVAPSFLETRGSCTLILRGLPADSWGHSPGASWSLGGPGKQRDCFGKSAGGVIILARFPGSSPGPLAQGWLGVGLMIPGRPPPPLPWGLCAPLCVVPNTRRRLQTYSLFNPPPPLPRQPYTHIVAEILLPLPGPSNAPFPATSLK